MIDTESQWMLRRDQLLCGEEKNVLTRSQSKGAINDLHTCCPGIVHTFDAEKQTITAQPAIKGLRYSTDGTQGEWYELPLCVDVPVVVLGGHGFSLTFPIQEGDECLLVFSERPIDNWFTQGGTAEQCTMRQYSLTDAFAIVGVRSTPNVIEDYNADAVELRSEDGQTLVSITDDKVHLEQGGNTVEIANGEVTLTAPTVKVNGNLQVSGTVNGIHVETHVHGGVYSGGSFTSGPQ
jgi:hypothetical protein